VTLYFSEGIDIAVVTVIIPIYFTELGISLPIISFIVGFSALPWAIKFIWGGIVDYFISFGRRRFIIVGGILGAIGFFLLAFIDPLIALVPFTFLMFIGHVGIAFLDVSADAWAIEISREDERGKINGAMFAGQFVGLTVGSTLLAIIANIYGYNTAFITSGLIIILIIIYPLFLKYTISSKKRQKVGSSLVREFKKKTTQLVALFAPFSAISAGFLLFAIPIYLKIRLNLDIAQIGLITGIFPIMVAVGSLIGGGISDKFGRKTSLYIFIGLSILFSALLIVGASWQILAFIYGVVGFFQGGYTTVTSAMCMDITNPRLGATQFSLLMSLFNVGEMAGAMVAGSLVVILGFERLFLYCGWIFGPSLLILYLIQLKKPVKNIT
jgi:PAT family beta-lactamase induction signal transducer AmpG